MARTSITPQRITPTGTAVALEPANVDGNAIDLARPRALWVKNASVAPVTVTLETPGTVAGLAVADRTVSVPAAGERLIRLDRVLRRSDGACHVNYSAVTSVTVAVLNT